MYGQNPNRSNPYTPFRYDKGPSFVGGDNPFHFGPQREQGALTPQMPARVGNDLNWFARPGPMRTRPMRPNYTYTPPQGGGMVYQPFTRRTQMPNYQRPVLPPERNTGRGYY